VVLVQAAELSKYRSWVARRDNLTAQKNVAAKAVPRDIVALAEASVALHDHLQLQTALVLTAEDCATLPQRHAEVVREVERRCEELLASEGYASLEVLAAKLKLLRAQNLSEPVPVAGNNVARFMLEIVINIRAVDNLRIFCSCAGAKHGYRVACATGGWGEVSASF
jgi:hypothetical protein